MRRQDAPLPILKAGEQSRVLVKNEAAARPRDLAWDLCPTSVP